MYAVAQVDRILRSYDLFLDFVQHSAYTLGGTALLNHWLELGCLDLLLMKLFRSSSATCSGKLEGILTLNLKFQPISPPSPQSIGKRRRRVLYYVSKIVKLATIMPVRSLKNSTVG